MTVVLGLKISSIGLLMLWAGGAMRLAFITAPVLGKERQWAGWFISSA